MRKGALLSALLHLAVFLIAIFGLPELYRPAPMEDHPIVVEMVQLADKTNPPPTPPQPPRPDKPVPKPKPEPTPAPPKPAPPKPAPPPPSPAPPPPPPPQPAPKPEPQKPVPPKPAPPKPAPEPVPAPKAKPTPPPPQPAKPAPSPLDHLRPQAKPKPPAPQKEKSTAGDFNEVLKSLSKELRQQAPKTAQKPDRQAAAAPAAASSGHNIPDEPLSISELDAIRGQIEACWYFDPGGKDVGNMTVEVHVDMNPDGTVRDAQLLSTSRLGDPFYRAMAESAMRALRNPKCVPLKLPPEKYDTWKSFTLNFDPKDMVQ